MTGQQTVEQPPRSQDWSWKFWHLVPIYPYGSRRTLRTEVVPETLWIFDQVQGIFYVVVPIRMTIVKLAAGGLLVYAPIAPTPECLRLVNELVARHGEVKYIILPTVSGLEHKVFVPAFARRFPTAQIFVVSHQWSFPVNLPLSWLGFPRHRTQSLPTDSRTAPFADEFDYAILGPLDLGLGWFGEAAFFHRRSRTLLVTDSVVSVPEEAPAIVQLDPYPLLFHAREDGRETLQDTPANRRKGWQRIALFSFFFRPSALTVVELGQSIRDAFHAPDHSRKAYFGWFPFHWKDTWQQSFAALHGNGRLFVAPILQQLILNRAPQTALDWATRVAQWDFHQIIPCHLHAPIAATPSQFRQAFAFLEKTPNAVANCTTAATDSLPEPDFALLQTLDKALSRSKLVPPAQEKV